MLLFYKWKLRDAEWPAWCHTKGTGLVSKSSCLYYIASSTVQKELPWWFSGKELGSYFRRCEFNPWVGNIPWRRKRQPTWVFLPGTSRGQRSLVGCGRWGGHNWATKTTMKTLQKRDDYFSFLTIYFTKKLNCLLKNQTLLLSEKGFWSRVVDYSYN